MRLHMRPNQVMSFDEFVKIYKNDAVAIDGFVNEPPRYDLESRLINLNHHIGCSRLETRATCAQALILARMGLKDLFPESFTICTNDCDEDVCLTTYILMRLWQAEQLFNPLLNKLVACEDMLDATSGAYPVNCSDPSFLEMCWVFEPYKSFRNLGGLECNNADDYADIVLDVGLRIEQYLVGKAKEAKLKIKYEVVSKTSKVAVVKEVGAQCRYKIFDDGIDLFISVRPTKDGKNVVTIVKRSPFVKIDLLKLTAKLNELEPKDPARFSEWGGGDMVIGSPKGNGTTIPINELALLVESYRK